MNTTEPTRPRQAVGPCPSLCVGIPCARPEGHAGRHFAPSVDPCNWTDAESATGHELPPLLVAWVARMTEEQASEIATALAIVAGRLHVLEALLLNLRSRGGWPSAQAAVIERAIRLRTLRDERARPVGWTGKRSTRRR